jgi:hypothetical protein
MLKFGRGDRQLREAEPVIDVSKVMPPQEKFVFKNADLENLFDLSAIESLSAWNNTTVEDLLMAIGKESALSGKSEVEVKERLVARMAVVEKGLNAIKSSQPSAIESTVAHLRMLRNGLE